MDPQEQLRLQAEAEAEAEAQAQFQFEQHQKPAVATPAPEENPITGGIAQGAEGLWNFAKQAASVPGKLSDEVGAKGFSGALTDEVRSAYDTLSNPTNQTKATLMRAGGGTIGATAGTAIAGPPGGVIGAGLGSSLAGAFNRHLGYEDPNISTNGVVKDLVANTTAAAIPVAASKAVGGTLTGLTNALKGPSAEVQEFANVAEPGVAQRTGRFWSTRSMGNILGYDDPQTLATMDNAVKKYGLVNGLKVESENPVEGINSFNIYKQRVAQTVDSLSKEKTALLANIDSVAKENNLPLRINIEPELLAKTDGILSNQEPAASSLVGPDGSAMPQPPRNFTATSANEYLKNVYSKLAELKAFDKSGAATSPSQIAQTKTQVSLLYQTVDALKSGIAKHADAVITKFPEDARFQNVSADGQVQPMPSSKIAELNDDMHALINLRDQQNLASGDLQIARAQAEANGAGTGIDMAVATRGHGNMLNTAMEMAAPGRAQNEAMAKVNSMPGNNILTLQRMIDYRFNGQPAPLPRNYDIISKNPALQIGLSGLLTTLGVIPSPDVYKQASEPDKSNMMKVAVQTAPQAFEQGPYNFKSVIDGKLLDPMERDSYIQMVKNKNLPPGKEAAILGPLFKDNSFIPMEDANINKPVMAPPQAMIPKVSSVLNNVMANPQPMNKPTDSNLMLQQMKDSMNQTDAVRSGM